MLITNAEINGHAADLRASNGVITKIAAKIEPHAHERPFDAERGALLPGLHDHHLHFYACAAAMSSVMCGPPEVNDQQELIRRLKEAPGAGPIRAIGYHDSVAGEIDRGWLDAHGPPRPIRVQHRSGRLWIFNSAAIDLADADIPFDGRFYDGDRQLRNTGLRPDPEPLRASMLAYGITGFTEVTPKNDQDDFTALRAAAGPLRHIIMGRAGLAPHAVRGPVKLHYHEYDLPSLDELTMEIRAAHEDGRAIASHCVTRAELMLTLAAIEAAGAHPGDRIEHCAIAGPAEIEWIARLGLTVVTQPHFIAERSAAYITDVPVRDQPDLWRLGSLHRAGIKMSAGSDAPFGGLNPWAAMANCCVRPAEFENVQSGEAISPEAALALYTKPARAAGGPPRTLIVGQAADLCLLTQTWKNARRDLKNVKVRATWIDGQRAY